MSVSTVVSVSIENLFCIAAAYSEGTAGRVLHEVWRRFEVAIAESSWRCEQSAWGVQLHHEIASDDGDHFSDIEAIVHEVAIAPVVIGSVRVMVALGFRRDRRPVDLLPLPSSSLDAAQYRFDMGTAVLAYSLLRDGEIAFAEQPIVSAADGVRVLYSECLLRLAGYDGGVLAPGVYLPSIERLGLTRTLDRRVVRATILRLRARPDDVLGCNISGLSVCNDLWWHSIVQELRECPDIAKRLVLEVTETASPPDIEDALSCLTALRQTGCRIALDDFGAGVSSIAFARQLHPDIIKIDGLYVRETVSLETAEELLSSLVSMSLCLADDVVVEGVEDIAAVAAAKASGAQWLQGYFTGRPRIPEEPKLRKASHLLSDKIVAFAPRSRAEGHCDGEVLS